MSKRLLGAIVLISILILAMLAGCQSQANSGTAISGAPASDGNTIFGQVTAVDGNNITVALIDNNGMGNGREGQGNQGASSSNRPQRSQGSRPSENWQQSQGNGGTAPSGGRGLNTTGETKTFTVTSSTTITNGGMRQYSQNSGSAPASASASPPSISDIQKGSILSVKLSGDNAVSIIIMQFGNRNGNGGNAQASDSPAPGGSDSSQSSAQPSPSAAPSPNASAAPSSGATPTPSIGAISSY